MQLRYYQQEAVDAICKYLREQDGNPCVEIPTGAGKSLILSSLIQRWLSRKPDVKVLVLAHRKELVEQNVAEFATLCPSVQTGVYCAGLGRKDGEMNITFAAIDSLYKHPSRVFAPHVVIVDECHLISPKDGTKYQKLLANFRNRNPKVRVVGLTATPYRMDSGNICHDDFILNEIVYRADVGKLIDEGFLSQIRAKLQPSPDTSNVRKNGKGDYVTASLASVVDVPKVVQSAVKEAVRIIEAENRKGVMFFCVNQEHSEHVSACLATHGIHAPVVTAKTPASERDHIVAKFKNRALRCIVNIDVYTTGFNAKHVDCIVMLRPTLSKGLYSQILGRGLRIHPDKQDCLVLDFAGNIERHGPIDCLSGDRVRMHKCGGCGDSFAFPLGKCPHCDTPIPKEKREAVEKEERERKLHDERIAQAQILGAQPQDHKVDEVMVHRHVKPGGVDSLRVEYRCGLNVYREWVCLDHGGQAGKDARKWWLARFDEPVPTVDDALDGMLGGFTLGKKLTDMTISISTKKDGKYDRIIWHQIKGRKL
jgi:DNA repair protein RadD